MANFYLISRAGDDSLTEIVPKGTEWTSLVTWHQVCGKVHFTCLLPLLTAYPIQHQVSGGIGEAMTGMSGESLVWCLWLLGGKFWTLSLYSFMEYCRTHQTAEVLWFRKEHNESGDHSFTAQTYIGASYKTQHCKLVVQMGALSRQGNQYGGSRGI